jgi:uncharacterized protein
VIAIDTNLLLHAHRADSPFHERALASIVGLAEARGAWAIPWSCLHEFVSTATHPRVFNPPTKPAVAIAAVNGWLGSPTLQVLHETPEHWQIICDLITSGRIDGSRVHDARIAAVCLGNGVREFWTADRDFSRFPSLTVRNPLIG